MFTSENVMCLNAFTEITVVLHILHCFHVEIVLQFESFPSTHGNYIARHCIVTLVM